MKRTLSSFLALLALAACSSRGEPFVTSPTPPTRTLAAAAPSPLPADLFKVDAWVNQLAPAREERVIVYGSLIYRGVRLGGVMMRATWSQEGYEGIQQDCFVLVTYGRGVCTLAAADFQAGVSVPVTVSFDYQGQTYTGQAQFTPR